MFSIPGSRGFKGGQALFEMPGSKSARGGMYLTPGSRFRLFVPQSVFGFGATTPIFPSIGNHGVYDSTTNKTWFTFEGWTGGARCPRVVVYNHNTNRWSPVYRTMADTLVNDAHGLPFIGRDSNGYWHLYYGIHLQIGGANKAIHISTLNPDDPSVWVTNQGTLFLTEYPTPTFIGSTLYMLLRDWPGSGNNFGVDMVTAPVASSGLIRTIDYSTTNIISSGTSGRNYYNRPFVKSGTEIHFTTLLTNIANSAATNVYYFIYNTGTGQLTNFAKTRTDGPAGTGAFPVLIDGAGGTTDLAYRIATTNSQQFLFFVFDTANNPHVLYTNVRSDGNYDVIHAVNFGSSWVTTNLGITPAGYESSFGTITALANGGVAAYWNDINGPSNGYYGSPAFVSSVWGATRSAGSSGTWSSKREIFSVSSGAYPPLGVCGTVFNAPAGFPDLYIQQQIQDVDTQPGIGTLKTWFYCSTTEQFMRGQNPKLAASPQLQLSQISNSANTPRMAYSNNNLTAKCTSSGATNNAQLNVGVVKGQKCYWEIVSDNDATSHLTNDAVGASHYYMPSYLGQDSSTWGYFDDGGVYSGASTILAASVAMQWGTGDVLCIALDTVNSLFWVRKNNGNWNNNVSANPATATGGFALPTTLVVHEWMPTVELEILNDQMTIRPYANSWTFSAPTGFSAIGANV